MDDDFQNKFIVRFLGDLSDGGQTTLEEFLKDLGAEEIADWARHPDGRWKTWKDLDSEEHGARLWRALLEWHTRHEDAEFLLAEAGLVDPQVPKLDEQLRELEAAGKADTLEYARVKLNRDYLRAPLEVMRERGKEDS